MNMEHLIAATQKVVELNNRNEQLQRELNDVTTELAKYQNDSGDDSLYNVRRLRTELNEAKAENARLTAIADDHITRYHETAMKLETALFGADGESFAKTKTKLNEAIKELTHLANLIDAHFENGGTIAGLGTTNKARQIIKKSKP